MEYNQSIRFIGVNQFLFVCLQIRLSNYAERENFLQNY